MRLLAESEAHVREEGTILSPTSARIFGTDTPQDRLFAAALGHPAIFLDNFAYIYDPATQRHMRFLLWDWQWKLLADMTQHKRVIILKARQLGVSWLLAGYALWMALSQPNSNILLISMKEKVAAELLAKCYYIFRYLPPQLRPPRHPKDRNNDTALTFGTLNSKISALASTKESGRSEASSLVIPDEWAFHPDAVDMFSSYEPTLGVEGQIVGCSTANGRSGLFYDTYLTAKRGEGQFYPVFLSWRLRPDYTEEFVAAKKAQYEAMGELYKAAQEMPENDTEAFGGSVNTYFPKDALDRISAELRKPIKTELDGNLRIWSEPRDGQRYVIGADVADGGERGSRSAASVIEARTGVEVASFAGYIDPFDYAKVLVDLGNRYGRCLIAPELNNHGHAVLAAMDRVWHYDHIYTERTKGKPRIGWLTNEKTRHEMYQELKHAVSDGSFITYDEGWLEEAYTFAEDAHGRPGAISGARDDRITASAIGWMARHQFPVLRGVRKTMPLSR